MVIIGLDMSSNTGYSVLAHGGGTEVVKCGVLTYTLKGTCLEERLHSFQRDVRTFISEYEPTAVVFELAHMRGGAATRNALGMETVLKMECWLRNVPAHGVHSMTLKKFATGFGGATKGDMILAAEKLTGVQTANDNVADALCLGKWGVCNVSTDGVIKQQCATHTKRRG